MRLRDNPERSWEWYGANEPYFGVLADNRFCGACMTDADLDEFFAGGQKYVTLCLDTIRRRFDPVFVPRRALDFGCGVGRLLVSLGKICPSVGVDFSEPMLQEAAKHCTGLPVELVKSESSVTGSFDLIISCLVFQHIPARDGEQIIRHLIEHLEPGGFASLHLTTGIEGSAYVWRAFQFLCRNFPPMRAAFNLVRGRPIRYPMMQSNFYSLNRMLAILEPVSSGFYVDFLNKKGVRGAVVFFQKARLDGESAGSSGSDNDSK